MKQLVEPPPTCIPLAVEAGFDETAVDALVISKMRFAFKDKLCPDVISIPVALVGAELLTALIPLTVLLFTKPWVDEPPCMMIPTTAFVNVVWILADEDVRLVTVLLAIVGTAEPWNAIPRNEIFDCVPEAVIFETVFADALKLAAKVEGTPNKIPVA